MSKSAAQPDQLSRRYPTDIRILTSLRFAAALWVLVYFFGDRLGWREASGFVAKGYLGVDLFFILSGFILAHVYGARLEAQGLSKFAFGSFLWARLARIYPVHLVVLGGFVILWAIASTLGLKISDSFDPKTLWAHVLLLHAWNVVPSGGWNHPSWSISAEWFAYLIFPCVGLVCAKVSKTQILAPIMLLGLFPAAWAAGQVLGFPRLTELTGEGGFLRIVPSFFAGSAIWSVGRRLVLPRVVGLGFVGLSALGLIIATSLGAPDLITWFGLVGTVFGLAETSKFNNSGFARGHVAIYLGEISYSLYMGHALVDLIVTQIAARLLPTLAQTPKIIILISIVGFLGSLIFAVILFHSIEKPARSWMRARDPFKH